MIRTLEIQSIDPKMRFSGVVYMRATKEIDSDTLGIVQFNNYFSTLQTKEEIIRLPRMVEETYCSAFDPITGEKTFATREVEKMMPARANVPRFVDFTVQPAKYKKSTFNALFPNLTPADYDANMIAQIEYVNSKDWTGNEAQKVFFWDLTASDMEIVTPEMQADLLTVEFLEWIEG